MTLIFYQSRVEHSRSQCYWSQLSYVMKPQLRAPSSATNESTVSGVIWTNERAPPSNWPGHCRSPGRRAGCSWAPGWWERARPSPASPCRYPEVDPGNTWDVSLEDQQNKGLCLTVCISISQLKVLFVLIFLIAGLALVSSLTIRWIIDQIWSTMSASLLSSPHIHSGLLDIQELRNFPLFLAQRAEVFEGVRHKPLVSRD